VSFSITMQVPDLSTMADEMRQRIEDTVAKTAHAVEADVKASMIESTPTGRVYVRGGIPHQASAPGEPPAPDIGTLVGSIRSEEIEPSRWHVYVANGLEYAAALEYGYPPHNLAPRPYMRPAADRARETFRAAIVEALKP
jgi:hypothetical protein